MNCTYTYSFPVDEWGRLGGLYSTADVPIAKFQDLTRDGIIIAQNEKGSAYKVRDVKEGFVRWVPSNNVEVEDDSSI